MINSLKADFRKLLTVRSTYFMTLIALALVTLVSGYFNGYKKKFTDEPVGFVPTELDGANNYIHLVTSMNAATAAVFISLIAILFVAHEYRYNTIMYTLTANASRVKVWLSKIITISIFGALLGTFISIYGVLATIVGLKLNGTDLPDQDFDLVSLGLKLLAYFVGYALLSTFIAFILRSLVGAIALYFVYPTLVEQSLGALLLKDNANYLTFKSLDSIIFPSAAMSANTALWVAGLWLLGIGALSLALFWKRDAN